MRRGGCLTRLVADAARVAPKAQDTRTERQLHQAMNRSVIWIVVRLKPNHDLGRPGVLWGSFGVSDPWRPMSMTAELDWNVAGDAELAGAAATGDPAALAGIYDRYAD